MRRRLAFGIRFALVCGAMVLWAFAALPMRAAVVPDPAVIVRVYDAAGLDVHALASALDTATSTLAGASVGVVWRHCRGRDVCQRPIQRGELSLRFVRAAVSHGFKGDMPLGDARVDPHRRIGALGTVYVDRVEWLAAETRQDRATLLGRTVAHELGHLLLARSTHSASGLMRAIWSHDEIRLGRAADWAFTDADITEIRARLNGDDTTESTAADGTVEKPAYVAPSRALDDAQIP